jgi:hypothetical protein
MLESTAGPCLPYNAKLALCLAANPGEKPSMIIVHHLNNSRSQRVLWLLEELGLPYEIKKYQRDPDTMLAPPELRAVHPLGKSPVIGDGDTVVAESGAIIEYLVGRYASAWRRPRARPNGCATPTSCTTPKARR